jgi:hypothetical protein
MLPPGASKFSISAVLEVPSVDIKASSMLLVTKVSLNGADLAKRLPKRRVLFKTLSAQFYVIIFVCNLPIFVIS